VDRFVVGCGVRNVERIAYSVNGAVQMTGEFLRDVIDWFVEPMAVSAIEPFEIRRLGGFDTTEQGFEYWSRQDAQSVGSFVHRQRVLPRGWRGAAFLTRLTAISTVFPTLDVLAS
jgi:hypothetical protein